MAESQTPESTTTEAVTPTTLSYADAVSLSAQANYLGGSTTPAEILEIDWSAIELALLRLWAASWRAITGG
jgi:hypothetical protein